MRNFNRIRADKNSFTDIGTDILRAGFEVVGKAENIVNGEQKVCHPNSLNGVADVVKRRPTENKYHNNLRHIVAIKRVFVSAEFRNELFTPKDITRAYPAVVKYVCAQNLDCRGATDALERIEIVNEAV